MFIFDAFLCVYKEFEKCSVLNFEGFFFWIFPVLLVFHCIPCRFFSLRSNLLSVSIS